MVVPEREPVRGRRGKAPERVPDPLPHGLKRFEAVAVTDGVDADALGRAVPQVRWKCLE